MEPAALHQAGAPELAAAVHSNPATPLLLALVVILVAAKLAAWGAQRLKQPAVLGELLAGVVLGNLALVGFTRLEFLRTDSGVQMLAELGVVLLLFEVGLESNIHEMLSVGWSSLLVALLGVAAPFLLGFGVSAWLLPAADVLVHMFVGATLCATSVGITARVLGDLGKLQARESKIILGAAVIDDVLGLVILAVVGGAIAAANAGTPLAAGSVLWIVAKAVLFLFGAVVVGGWAAPRLFRLASRLEVSGMLLVASLAFCFLLAYLASAVGLATIVGAFAAGLVLDTVHYKEFLDRGERGLEHLLAPITTFLVPLFFVRMGVEVDLATFERVEVLGLAALLTGAAIVGKLVCWGGVLERGLDRLSIAVGMVPRGEVGLIFAGVGAQLMLHGERVISPSLFSALVIVVIVTTLITPPLLEATLARASRRRGDGRETRPRRRK